MIHINHHTRGIENSKEQNLVQQMCLENNIKIHVCDYYHHDGNFQKQARLFRIENYKKIINVEKLDGVVLAHHLDDQVENILMNSEKIGYKLMEEISNYETIKIFRPLLNYFKEDIINYANKYKIKYMEDSSNLIDKYKRNYYRLNNKLNNLEKIEKVNNEKNKKKLIIKYENLELTKKTYFSVEDKKLFIYVKIKEKIKKNISKNLIDEIVNNLDFCGSKKFKLPDNYYFFQSYDDLSIDKLSEENICNYQQLKKGLNEFNGIKFYSNFNDGIIRTYEKNDKIKLKNGHKKINRFFIDQKIPKEQRKKWPIIVNKENEVIFVPKEMK